MIFKEGRTYRIRTATPCQHIRPGRLEVIRLVSNPVEITIQPFENSPQQAEQAIHWGEQVDGLQLGLYFDLDRDYFYQGERVGFNVYARNTGDKTIILQRSVFPPLTIHDSNGQRKQIFVPLRDSFPVQPVYLTIDPGQTTRVCQTGFSLAQKADNGFAYYFNPEPGIYSVQQRFEFRESEQANWHGELATGTLTMKILPEDTAVEIDTAEIIRILEKEQINSIMTTHSQSIYIILTDGRQYKGTYVYAEAGKYADDPNLFDILNLVMHIQKNRSEEQSKNWQIVCE